MRIHSPLFLLAATGLLLGGAAAAQTVDTSEWKCSTCPYPKAPSGSVEAGIAAVTDDAERFGDYTGLDRQGAKLLLGGHAMWRGEGGGWADAWASDLGLASRSLGVRGGVEGVVTLRAAYDAVPRHFFDDARTPFLGVGGSLLTLPAGYPAGSTGAMPLASTLQPVEFGYDRSRLDASAAVVAVDHWTYRVDFRRDVRDGTRALVNSFYATAAQLVAPVDQVTDELGVTAAYATSKLQASLGYEVSRFRNGHDALVWDNPFNLAALGATRAELALAPDNELHQITASLGYTVTPTIRASADVAYGRLTQNQPFLAPTTNPLLAPTLPALPRASLDGRVDTFVGTLRVSAAPLDDLRLVGSYTRNVRDNRTDVAAYTWVSADLFVRDPRENTPFDLTQDRFKFSADWRGIENVKLSGGIEHDYRSRPYHEAVTTRETTVFARAGWQAREDLSLTARLAHADRSHSTYGTAIWWDHVENPLLRKPQLAARTRVSAGVRADYTVSETVSVGASLDVLDDDYRDAAIGLNRAATQSLGVDVSAAVSEQTRVTAYASHERAKSRIYGSESFSTADWVGRIVDRYSVVGVGVRHTASEALELGADLTLSRATNDVAVDTAVPTPPYPTNRADVDRLKLFASYKLNDNLWLDGSYWHERYRSQDWRYDGVLPATVPGLLVFGVQSPDYSVDVFGVSLRYRF